jgi:hypothetical protein
MENMCIKSFQRQGHPFRLYVYNPVANVPAGTLVADAEQIVPKSDIARFQNLANFSDYFRYSMLFQNGGYWVDLDNFCLRPYDFPEEYVFSSQLTSDRGMDEGNAGVIKAPKNSPVMQYCLNKIDRMDVSRSEWAAIGPIMLRETYQPLRLGHYMKPHHTFCPLHYFEAPANVFSFGTWDIQFPSSTYSVHLWNEEARRSGIDKYAAHQGSLFERLKETVQ